MSSPPAGAGAPRISFVSQLNGIGGPAGFQRRLAAELVGRGIQVGYDLAQTPYQAVLVIGGTRHLEALAGAKRRGARIVQRLDGINWMHRRFRTGLRHYLRSEINNRLMRWVRSRYADHVVYQSQFARQWWERSYGPTPVPASVVYNGVPLDRFTPKGTETPPPGRLRLLMVEANYAGGYEHGLTVGFDLANEVAMHARKSVELTVAGHVHGGTGQQPQRSIRTRGAGRQVEQSSLLSVDWRGRVEPEAVPALYRSAHLLFSADLNPACPNSVIEAMACGLPVVSFDTGALPELVQGDAGRLAPFGGDPWIDDPQPVALLEPAMQLLDEQPRYRAGARSRAEAAFGLDQMADGYLAVLFPRS